MIAGGVAILGHLFPVWLKFKGGKGVATTLGTLIAINWMVGIGACVVWLVVAVLFRYSSLSALIAVAAVAVPRALARHPRRKRCSPPSPRCWSGSATTRTSAACSRAKSRRSARRKQRQRRPPSSRAADPKRTTEIEAFWRDAIEAVPGLDPNAAFTIFSFGDNPELSEHVLAETLAGRNRATASLRWGYEATLPKRATSRLQPTGLAGRAPCW